METFCADYYENQILGESSKEIFDSTFQLLTDSFPDFSKVNRKIFDLEMSAMNFELFSLALYKKYSNIDKAIQQEIFTFRYLEDKKRSDILDSISAYNKTVAKTATLDKNGQPLTGDTAIGRMTIIRVNELRFNSMKQWMQSHFKDPEHLTEDESKIANCVGRACNHIEADILRNNEYGNRLITGQFLFRIGAEDLWGTDWRPSQDFLLRTASQSYSMYDFANNTIKKFDLQFS